MTFFLLTPQSEFLGENSQVQVSCILSYLQRKKKQDKGNENETSEVANGLLLEIVIEMMNLV